MPSDTNPFTRVPANVFRDLMRPLTDKRAPKVYMQSYQDSKGGVSHFYCLKTDACVARVQRPKRNRYKNKKGGKVYEIDYMLACDIIDGYVKWDDVLTYLQTLAEQSHAAHSEADPNAPSYEACTICHYPKRALKFLEEARYRLESLE